MALARRGQAHHQLVCASVSRFAPSVQTRWRSVISHGKRTPEAGRKPSLKWSTAGHQAALSTGRISPFRYELIGGHVGLPWIAVPVCLMKRASADPIS